MCAPGCLLGPSVGVDGRGHLNAVQGWLSRGHEEVPGWGMGAGGGEAQRKSRLRLKPDSASAVELSRRWPCSPPYLGRPSDML